MGIISVEQADRLYWLGRYTERVYTTLKIFSKSFDTLIDGLVDSYVKFCKDIDILEGNEAVPRKADLRAFVLMADEPLVWKSGLTRFSRNPYSFIVNSSQGGGFKDTWVLSQ